MYAEERRCKAQTVKNICLKMFHVERQGKQNTRYGMMLYNILKYMWLEEYNRYTIC